MADDDTQSTEVLSFRIDSDTARRIDNLRGAPHHVNVSSYLRAVIMAALDRDYPTPSQG
jgi:hypothetical protein